MSRPVTEADFRRPEFRDAKPEDYEFDGTGELARKDRWETGIRRIVGILEDAGHIGVSRRRFTVPDVVAQVERLVQSEVLTSCKSDNDGHCTHHKCPQLADGEPRKSGRHCPLDTHREGGA